LGDAVGAAHLVAFGGHGSIVDPSARPGYEATRGLYQTNV